MQLVISQPVFNSAPAQVQSSTFSPTYWCGDRRNWKQEQEPALPEDMNEEDFHIISVSWRFTQILFTLVKLCNLSKQQSDR